MGAHTQEAANVQILRLVRRMSFQKLSEMTAHDLDITLQVTRLSKNNLKTRKDWRLCRDEEFVVPEVHRAMILNVGSQCGVFPQGGGRSISAA